MVSRSVEKEVLTQTRILMFSIVAAVVRKLSVLFE
jgi:hypothetical protein